MGFVPHMMHAILTNTTNMATASSAAFLSEGEYTNNNTAVTTRSTARCSAHAWEQIPLPCTSGSEALGENGSRSGVDRWMWISCTRCRCSLPG